MIAKQQQSREMLEGTLIKAMMSSSLYSLKQPFNLAKELLWVAIDSVLHTVLHSVLDR